MKTQYYLGASQRHFSFFSKRLNCVVIKLTVQQLYREQCRSCSCLQSDSVHFPRHRKVLEAAYKHPAGL